MDTRHRRTPATAMAIALAAILTLSACTGGGGNRDRDGKDGRTPGAAPTGEAGASAVPLKSAKQDTRHKSVPWAPQHVPLPWSR